MMPFTPIPSNRRTAYPSASLATVLCGFLALAPAALADSADSNLFALSRGQAPTVDFSWSPASPTVGQPVQFTVTSSTAGVVWTWDFDGNGVAEQVAGDPTMTYTAAGPYAVTLAVTGPAGTSSVTKTVTVAPASGSQPYVTDLKWDYPGFFLERTDLDNWLRVTVNWAGGNPGTVRFSVNGGAEVTELATATGGTHVFDMASAFPVRLTASTVTITPVNAAGVVGVPSTTQVYVFPFPAWLAAQASAGGVAASASIGDGEVSFGLEAEFPYPHLNDGCTFECSRDENCHKCTRIPKWVPFLSGAFGLLETYGTIEGTVSSTGRGSLMLSGESGFVALGGGDTSRGVVGTVSGTGSFRLWPGYGLELSNASFELGLRGNIGKDVGLLEVFPQTAFLAELPFFSWINQAATLTGEIEPNLRFTAGFAQDPSSGRLRFKETTGALGLDLKGTLATGMPFVKLKGWLAGGGSFTLGLPEPFVREWEVHAEIGLGIDYSELAEQLFPVKDREWSVKLTCDWRPESSVSCARLDVDADQDRPLLAAGDGSLNLLRHPYSTWGPYSRAVGKARIAARSAMAASGVQETLAITNLFPGADPVVVPAGGASRLLLWVHQDPALPVLQSTGIAWSYFDGTSWSPQALIASDTRAELAPVAALDASGKVISAWVRIRDEAFSTPIDSVADLPLFHSRLEVVSAVFDPATGTWGPTTALTDDAALDGALTMASDPSGNLMLAWVSNAAGALYSTATEPSSVKTAFWNGSSWGAPVEVATGLAGVSSVAAARRGSEAVLIVPRDPDLAVLDDGVLYLYSWNGSSWSTAQPFAAGGGENRLPWVAYDSAGTCHVLWVRAGDLVQATTASPAPRTVRQASASMGFYGARLFAGPGGTLTLVYVEVVDNGPANIFARAFDPASQTWSEDLRLTVDPWMAKDVAGYHGEDGVLHLAYLAQQVSRTSRTVTIEGRSVTIPNIPVFGQTDLRLLDQGLVTDLAASSADLAVSPASPGSGQAVTATLRVRNTGSFATGASVVGIYEEDGSGGSVRLGEVVLAAPFRAGEVREVTYAFTRGAASAGIRAVVDDLEQVSEVLETNNAATWSFSNHAPVALVTASVTSGTAPLTVTFDASASSDPDGDALTFDWAFADGTNGASGAVVPHTFQASGLYPVTLAVTDARGLVKTVSVDVSTLAACASVAAPTLTVPSGAPSGLDYLVTWTETSPARTYEVEEALEPTFAAPTSRVVGSTAASFRRAVLAPTTVYHRVRAVDTCSGTTYRSAWSNTQAVTIQTVSAARFHPLTPCRILDTRNPDGPLGGPILAAGATRVFEILGGACGVPWDAKAAVANVTVTGTTGSGALVVYPGDLPLPGTSTVSFSTGKTRANNATVKLSGDGLGRVAIKNSSTGQTHVILDVSGYYR